MSSQILEATKQRFDIENQLLGLAKTGPEKYLTAQDLENVISDLREENERLQGLEDESKSLRTDKEVLGKLFKKCEAIKRSYEKTFEEAELVRKDPLYYVKKREFLLWTETKNLLEELKRESAQAQELHDAFQRSHVVEVESIGKAEKFDLQLQVKDMETEFLEMLNIREKMFELMQDQQERIKHVTVDTGVTVAELDCLVRSLGKGKGSDSKMPPGGYDEYLFDPETKALKERRDEAMRMLADKEKHNEALVYRIKNAKD
jgi:hypothetical protein